MARISIIYHSSTGNTYQDLCAIEEGAREAGAEVRLRKVRELAAPEIVATNPAWKAHHEGKRHLTEASLDDLALAKGRKQPDEILAAARYYARRIASVAESLVAERAQHAEA